MSFFKKMLIARRRINSSWCDEQKNFIGYIKQIYELIIEVKYRGPGNSSQDDSSHALYLPKEVTTTAELGLGAGLMFGLALWSG